MIEHLVVNDTPGNLEKLNRAIDFCNAIEKLAVTPSTAGSFKGTSDSGFILDLKGFLTIEVARNAGVTV